MTTIDVTKAIAALEKDPGFTEEIPDGAQAVFKAFLSDLAGLLQGIASQAVTSRVFYEAKAIVLQAYLDKQIVLEVTRFASVEDLEGRTVEEVAAEGEEFFREALAEARRVVNGEKEVDEAHFRDAFVDDWDANHHPNHAAVIQAYDARTLTVAELLELCPSYLLNPHSVEL